MLLVFLVTPVMVPLALGHYVAMRFAPQVVWPEADFNCGDSAGLYWTCPVMTATGKNVLSSSDSGTNLEQAIAASRSTNGNVPIQNINGLATRLQAFVLLNYVLQEAVATERTEQITFNWRRNSNLEPLFQPNEQPLLKPDGQQRHGFVVRAHTLNVPLEMQRP